jgi:hypothetical protein
VQLSLLQVCPFNIIFEGDCVQVTKALSSSEFDFSRVGHLYAIARSKLDLCNCVEIILLTMYLEKAIL